MARFVQTSRTERVLSRLTQGMQDAISEGAKATADVMIALTSGTTTTEELRREGNPFGRQPRAGRRLGPQRGTEPRLPINYQTGNLQRSLQIGDLRVLNGFHRSLGFTDPNAGWVLYPGGTRTMVARGFWNELRERAASPFKTAVTAALTNALKG